MSAVRYGQPYLRLHVVVGGLALCGRLVDHEDLFSEEAGPRVWDERPGDRCMQCSLHPMAASAGQPRPGPVVTQSARPMIRAP